MCYSNNEMEPIWKAVRSIWLFFPRSGMDFSYATLWLYAKRLLLAYVYVTLMIWLLMSIVLLYAMHQTPANGQSSPLTAIHKSMHSAIAYSESALLTVTHRIKDATAYLYDTAEAVSPIRLTIMRSVTDTIIAACIHVIRDIADTTREFVDDWMALSANIIDEMKAIKHGQQHNIIPWHTQQLTQPQTAHSQTATPTAAQTKASGTAQSTTASSQSPASVTASRSAAASPLKSTTSPSSSSSSSAPLVEVSKTPLSADTMLYVFPHAFDMRRDVEMDTAVSHNTFNRRIAVGVHDGVIRVVENKAHDDKTHSPNIAA